MRAIQNVSLAITWKCKHQPLEGAVRLNLASLLQVNHRSLLSLLLCDFSYEYAILHVLMLSVSASAEDCVVYYTQCWAKENAQNAKY